MTYWEAVLYEVMNKHKKTTHFLYTNLGEKRGQEIMEKDEARKGKNKIRHKIYYLGKKYDSVYFTQREAECVYLLLRGHTLVSAALELSLSPRTVEFYVKNMKMKLGCATKAKLIEIVAQSEFLNNLEVVEESEVI